MDWVATSFVIKGRLLKTNPLCTIALQMPTKPQSPYKAGTRSLEGSRQGRHKSQLRCTGMVPSVTSSSGQSLFTLFSRHDSNCGQVLARASANSQSIRNVEIASLRGRLWERFAHETAKRPVFHRLRLRLLGPALLERLPLNQFIADADYRLISLQYLGSDVDRRAGLKRQHNRVARPRIDFELVAASVKHIVPM